MRRVARILVVCVAGVLLSLAVAVPATAAPKLTPAQQFGGCLNSQGKGDVLVLIDTSLSLGTTDPTDDAKPVDQQTKRVQGTVALLDGLDQLASNNKAKLNVAIAGFSDDYESERPARWSVLPAGLTTIRGQLREFNDRHTGVQTDYLYGLDGALKALNAQAKDDPRRCQALVWLSDGIFDVRLSSSQAAAVPRSSRVKSYAPDADLQTKKGADEAKAAAEKQLCSDRGTATQLRRAGITVFAVGLQFDQDIDFRAMQRIATGSGGCGQGADRTPGQFVTVKDLSDLLAEFDKISHTGGATTSVSLCKTGDTTCRGVRFALDGSLTKVHIFASSDSSFAASLVSPRARLASKITTGGSGTISGVTPAKRATYSWSGTTGLSIDLLDPNTSTEPWVGDWVLLLKGDPSKTANVNLSIEGDISPSWTNQSAALLRSGGTASLVFGVEHENGRAIALSGLQGALRFDAQLQPAVGPAVVLPTLNAKSLAQPPPFDLTFVAPGPATLRLVAAYTTKATRGAGTALTPNTREYQVEILSPEGIPPAPPQVDFGAVVGPANADSVAVVTGPGCAWLPAGSQPDVLGGPDEASAANVTSTAAAESSKVCADSGATAQVPLHLSTAAGGNGVLQGTIPLVVSARNDTTKMITVAVPFTASMSQPVDTSRFLFALIAALLLGPGIPLVLLAVFKRLTATIPALPLLAQEMSVTVADGEVRREGQALTLRDTDFASMVRLAGGGNRSVPIGVGTLRTRTGWSPFGSGFVELETPGQVGLSSSFPRPWGKRSSARLSLAPQQSWVALRSPGDPAGVATVVVFVGLSEPGDRQRLLDDVAARLPDWMARLDTTAPGTPPATGSSDDAPFGAATTADDSFGDQPFPDQPAPQQPRVDPPPAWSRSTPTSTPPPPSPPTTPENDPWAVDLSDDPSDPRLT